MRGRKLDGEVQRGMKQAAFSALMRVHGICISRFVFLVALILSPIFLISPTHRLSTFPPFYSFICPSASTSLPLCLHPCFAHHHFFFSSPSHVCHMLSLSPPPFLVVSVLPPFPPPLCIWVADWTSSCRACERMASLVLFNWCCLMETSCLLDSVRWQHKKPYTGTS